MLGGGLTLSYARCSPVAEGTPDPAFPGNGTPTCEVPKRFQVTHTSFSHPASGWAAGLCTGRWIGSSSRRRSRWNSPACHPHNAVHSRGKGICTMPHLFCGTQWRRPHAGPSRRGANLSLALSLSHPDPIVQIPALSISKLLGGVDDKTTAAHCERVDRERCVSNRAAIEPALAGGGTGPGGLPLGRMTTEARRCWALSRRFARDMPIQPEAAPTY